MSQRGAATQKSRRRPALGSVSLPPSKKQKVDRSPTHGREHTGYPHEARRGLRLATKNPSNLRWTGSRGSAESDPDTSRWFESANKKVVHTNAGPENYEDEPPFFVSNQQQYLARHETGYTYKPFGAVTLADSEKCDLRDVIDDLTIENKRLKRLLRQGTDRRKTNTDQGKLFEIRMHGLTPKKKQELESLLRNFALTTDKSLRRSSSSSTTGASTSRKPGLLSSEHVIEQAKRTPTDSGYASNSGIHSAPLSSGGRHCLQQETVTSCLHDVPDTYQPRSQALTDKVKMKLVVHKLEQLFTGNAAGQTDHSQQMQQPEISRSVPRADRLEEAKYHKKVKVEASREAHVLPHDTKINLDKSDRRGLSPNQKGLHTMLGHDKLLEPSPLDRDDTKSGEQSPQQRPTRPFDLDVQRVQVPVENINYIRHLGLSSPRLNGIRGPQDDSWIYLNLLANMAQLHILSVTPDFIRRAIKKLSTKFELSEDGHKVRWKGGGDETSVPDEKANDGPSRDSLEALHDGKHSGGIKEARNDYINRTISESPLNNHGGAEQSSEISADVRNSIVTGQGRPPSSFYYKTIVFNGTLSVPHHESYLEDSSSSYDEVSGTYSRHSRSLLKPRSRRTEAADKGAITFFSDAYFCSDLSRDHAPVNMLPFPSHSHDNIIGLTHTDEWEESALRYHDACYFAPQFAAKAMYADADDENVPDFTLYPIMSAGEEQGEPQIWEVSGLGGVIPQDNFAIDVQVIRRVEICPRPQVVLQRPVTGTKLVHRFRCDILRASVVNLAPSRLPSPSYLLFVSSSSSSEGLDDSEDEDASDTSSSADSEARLPYPAFLQNSSIGSSKNRSAEVSARSSYADEVESAFDMLEAARAADPEFVAQQEREYVINQPDVAGIPSLAVTVGTGSASSSEGGYESSFESHVDETEGWTDTDY